MKSGMSVKVFISFQVSYGWDLSQPVHIHEMESFVWVCELTCIMFMYIPHEHL
jgi:hypothetical protein